MKRSMRILEILYKTKHTITIKELEEVFQISRSTVLSTLKFIKSLLPDTLALNVTEKKVSLCNYTNQSIEVVLIDIAKQTIPFQVLEHVFFDGKLTIRELAEKLFISESTLRIRIAHMNTTLATFKCNLSFYDVKLFGDETNIRYFFYTYFSEFQELFVSVSEDRLQYCSDIYNNMKKLLTQHGNKLLNYSYQQVERWLLITRDRMEIGKFVSIKPSLATRIQKRASYQHFRTIYKSEIVHHLGDFEIPEAEVIWAYIIGFNCIIYLNDDTRALYFDEPDNIPYKEKIMVILNKLVNVLGVLDTDKENFFAIHTAYLINLSLLTEISPILQLGSTAIKDHIIAYSENLFTTWYDYLSNLQAEDLFPISSIYSITAQLTMLSSPFIYNRNTNIKKILYSFEGEAGFTTFLDTLAKLLLPSNIKSIFIYNDPLTPVLIQQIQPDLIVSNHKIPEHIGIFKTFRMSYIPQIQEWTLLKELIIRPDISK